MLKERWTIMSEADEALQSPDVNLCPGPEYGVGQREWQGIPGIERTPTGRLWATWYSGGTGEGPDNYVLLVRSDDDGSTWTEPLMVIDPPGKVRAFDPAVWMDPAERLWLFWAQSYELFDGRAGVWAITSGNADGEASQWSEPRRICNGIMLNKPTVLSTGQWLLPAAVWARSTRQDMDAERYSNVFVSSDQGATFNLLGQADVPDRVFDEHMIVERNDGSLWMLVRTSYGIGESISEDRGKNWSPGRDSGLGGPCSRFFIRRLQSGRLLLVNHRDFTGRNNLAAMLSDDDGRSWPHSLMLDTRDKVSYPDGVEGPDGTIYIIYDHQRTEARQILLAVVTEEDIIAGEPQSPLCRLQEIVSRNPRSI
jgi:hypothetical protein